LLSLEGMAKRFVDAGAFESHPARR
jgi:hypothetical protein